MILSKALLIVNGICRDIEKSFITQIFFISRRCSTEDSLIHHRTRDIKGLRLSFVIINTYAALDSQILYRCKLSKGRSVEISPSSARRCIYDSLNRVKTLYSWVPGSVRQPQWLITIYKIHRTERI
ncbi:hypothetical protein D3C86_692960 [compost metagenome]